jgi:hypothetical protein
MSAVVVVTGAGASHDCISANSPAAKRSPVPPLTKDLFSPEYQSVLDSYPLVRQAARDIRLALRGSPGEDAIALEDFLRERMLKSSSPFTQRRYRQVPLYLQQVLAGASEYTDEPDNYNVLVNAALEKDEALFLTLNYDTLLDRRFTEYSPQSSMDWYVDSDSRWSLIKLHGSVDWAWRFELPAEYLDVPRNSIESANTVFDYYATHGFPELDNDAIELRVGAQLHERRWETNTGGEPHAVCYPAVALPLGPADELVCPSRHVEAAKAALDRMDGLDLLVVGYSGLDQEPLRLLSESGNSIRRLRVVNGDQTMSYVAGERIAAAFRVEEIPGRWIYPDSFSHAVETGALQDWLRAGG